MTWDEAELRAALREGEGETLSAGHIVALGQARQQRRHDRLRNAAVAVVVTGLLGGGVGALTQLNGGSESAGSASANGKNPAAGRDTYAGAVQEPAHGGVGGSEGSQPLAPAPSTDVTFSAAGGQIGNGASGGSAAGCLKAPLALSVPTGTAPGSTGALFAEPVASIMVCGYRERLSGQTYRLRGSTTLAGAAAGSLAADLEDLPTIPRTTSCAIGGSPILLTVKAYASGGRPLAMVTVKGSADCGATVTNGTAVRYAWQIPKALEDLTR
jgi:hypothetical protein